MFSLLCVLRICFVWLWACSIRIEWLQLRSQICLNSNLDCHWFFFSFQTKAAEKLMMSCCWKPLDISLLIHRGREARVFLLRLAWSQYSVLLSRTQPRWRNQSSLEMAVSVQCILNRELQVAHTPCHALGNAKLVPNFPFSTCVTPKWNTSKMSLGQLGVWKRKVGEVCW